MYPQFDRSRLFIKPLEQRKHDLQHSTLLELDAEVRPCQAAAMRDLVRLGNGCSVRASGRRRC